MSHASLPEIVEYCQALLQPETFEDWDGAVNGLQIQNSGNVTRIAASVDASLATVKMAVAAKADLLVTHHGLFWSSATQPWTGRRYELFELLVKNNLAVFSSHLPLDAHPEVGNNAQLSKALGLRRLKPFFLEKGRFLGFQSTASIARDTLGRALGRVIGNPPILLPCGPERCRRIGIVTGAAGSQLKVAAAEGVDTFITGEGPHWTHALAEDLGLNVFYGGHYATETFGVKALAARLSKAFDVPWIFLDHPSGL